MSYNRPFTQVITDKRRKKRVLIKDKRNAYTCGIKQIEAEMRHIYFNEKPTGANVIAYLVLEAQWKKLTNYKTE